MILLHVVLHLIRMVLSNWQFFNLSVAVKKDLLVMCEEVSIFFRWNHGDVFDYMLVLRDQPWLIFFKVKMNVYQHLSLTLGKSQLELLFMPSFAYPAHVFNWLTLHSMVLSYDCHFKTIHLLLVNRVQQCLLFFLNDQEPSRVDPAIITSIVYAIDVLIWFQTLSNDLSCLFAEIIERNVDMLKSAIGLETCSNGLCASYFSTVSELIQTIIKYSQHFVASQQTENPFPHLSRKIVSANVKLFQTGRFLNHLSQGIQASQTQLILAQVQPSNMFAVSHIPKDRICCCDLQEIIGQVDLLQFVLRLYDHLQQSFVNLSDFIVGEVQDQHICTDCPYYLRQSQISDSVGPEEALLNSFGLFQTSSQCNYIPISKIVVGQVQDSRISFALDKSETKRKHLQRF